MSKELNKNKIREIEKKLYPKLDRNLYVNYLFILLSIYLLAVAIPPYFKGYKDGDYLFQILMISIFIVGYTVYVELSNLNVIKNSFIVKIENKYKSGFVVFNVFMFILLSIFVYNVTKEPVIVGKHLNEMKETIKEDIEVYGCDFEDTDGYEFRCMSKNATFNGEDMHMIDYFYSKNKVSLGLVYNNSELIDESLEVPLYEYDEIKEYKIKK